MRKGIFYLLTFVLGVAVGASLVWMTTVRDILPPEHSEVSQIPDPVEPSPRFVGIGHINEPMNLIYVYRTDDYQIVSESGPAFRSAKEARHAIREQLRNSNIFQHTKDPMGADYYLGVEKMMGKQAFLLWYPGSYGYKIIRAPTKELAWEFWEFERNRPCNNC